jgi:hypothetical protein
MVPDDGWYRITLRNVRGINPGADGAVWGTLRSGTANPMRRMLFMIGLVEATGTPRDMVSKPGFKKPSARTRPNDGTLQKAPTGAKGGNVSFKGRDLAKEGFEGIAHSGIDVERIYPNAIAPGVRKKLFGGEA